MTLEAWSLPQRLRAALVESVNERDRAKCEIHAHPEAIAELFKACTGDDARSVVVGAPPSPLTFDGVPLVESLTVAPDRLAIVLGRIQAVVKLKEGNAA